MGLSQPCVSSIFVFQIAGTHAFTGRTPYDEAADALGLLRGALVPEQDLGGFGANPPKLQRKLELFFHRRIEGRADVDRLIQWFDAEQAPSFNELRASTA